MNDKLTPEQEDLIAIREVLEDVAMEIEGSR